MGKGKKKKGNGPPELLVVEAEEFPDAVIVELWHRNAKGKREFLDSRRFEVAENGRDAADAGADATDAASAGD
jgi:hypothetical protein